LFLLPYPYHYETYGFKGAKKYGISMHDGNFYSGIQALPLSESELDNITGIILFALKLFFSDYIY
jgi:predicted N-acetyltransferase YhbS